MQETRVHSLGQEDPLEKEMATHSSILAWRIPWTEEPGWLQPMGSQRVRHNWVSNTFSKVLGAVIDAEDTVLRLKRITISNLVSLWGWWDRGRNKTMKELYN